MPWWSGPRPEVIRELRDRYPGLTLDRIGIEATQRSEYADEFARLEARAYTGAEWLNTVFLYSPDDFPRIAVPAKERPTSGTSSWR